MTRPTVRIDGAVQGCGLASGTLETPTFSATGNAGVPDPTKWYPMSEDIVDQVDSDAPTVYGTIGYAYSAALGRNLAWFDGSTDCARYAGANLADYHSTGACSGMVFTEPRSSTVSPARIVVAAQSNGELEADNALWSLQQDGVLFKFFSEYGAGVNDSVTVPLSRMVSYVPYMYGWTRAADGVTIRHFINGAFVGETTGASAPTGGSTAEFIIAYSFAASPFHGGIGQFAWWKDTTLTDEQMIAAHRLAAPRICPAA